MRPFVTGVDRLGTLVLGLLLLAIGVGLLVWAVVQTDNATVLTAPGLATAAADQLSSHPAVRSAKGSAIIDRGAPSIQLKATASSAETLAEAVHAADDIATTATGMLGDAIVVRTRLHVDTKRRAERRLA